MAFALYNTDASRSTALSTSAVDLSSIGTVCPANERASWQTLAILLEEAVSTQADEIHLEPDHDCLRLRMRSPFSFNELRIEHASEYLGCLSLLQHYLWKDASTALPRRAWFSFSLHRGPRLMQLDAVPTARGDTFLITLLHDLKLPPARLEELALSKTQQVQLRQLLKVDAGLILLASGNARNRAQTARAIAQDLVAPDRKIACADIPGHPWLPRVTQLAMDQLAAADQQQLWSAVCELGCDAIVAWQSSSDEMVRQLARQASESTLVVQGLGVNTPADAVARMLSMGVRSEALARSLTAIVLQTPLQSLCPWCRSMQTPDDQGTAWLSTHSPIKSGNINDWLRQRMRSSFSTAEGCDRCQHTGRGKSLDLFTIVTLDDAVTDALYGSDIRLALTRLREKPFMTRDLLRLAQEGIISLAEAARLVPVC